MYVEVLRNKYDQFGGRAGRREFWLFMLVHVIVIAAATIVDFLWLIEDDVEGFALGPIFWIYLFATFVPMIALGARRLHDTGRSGWWQVLVVAWIPAGVLALVTGIVVVAGGSEADVAVFGTLTLVFAITAVVGHIVLLVFALASGDQDDNQYGSPGESPDRPAVYSTVISTRYAQFSGRAGRKEFWLFTLVNGALFSITMVVGDAWVNLGESNTNPITAIYGLITIIPALALGARRLHDIGRSGWWQLLILLPVIGLILLIVWAIMPSNEGENSHGEPAEVPA